MSYEDKLPSWCRRREDPQGRELTEDVGKQRKCLKCDTVFLSMHGNRLCSHCKELPVYVFSVLREEDYSCQPM